MNQTDRGAWWNRAHCQVYKVSVQESLAVMFLWGTYSRLDIASTLTRGGGLRDLEQAIFWPNNKKNFQQERIYKTVGCFAPGIGYIYTRPVIKIEK